MEPQNFCKWLASIMLVLFFVLFPSCGGGGTDNGCPAGQVFYNNLCITPVCSGNSSCNDNNACTNDICNNPNTDTASCSYTPNIGEEMYGDGIDNDCDGLTDEDLRIAGSTIIYATGSLSFDQCELHDTSKISVANTLSIACNNLIIDSGASINADYVGDSAKCDGETGHGGGNRASGGGGGGGCFAANGGDGGRGDWIQVATSGIGGTDIYNSSPDNLLPGSKGGEGGGYGDPPGLGGGAIYLKVIHETKIDGSISANGNAGGNGRWDDGGSGGGSGGIIIIETDVLTLGPTSILSAKGGNGGNSGIGGGGGGGGSGGYIKFKYNTKTASSTILDVTGGAAGLTTSTTAKDGNGGSNGAVLEF